MDLHRNDRTHVETARKPTKLIFKTRSNVAPDRCRLTPKLRCPPELAGGIARSIPVENEKRQTRHVAGGSAAAACSVADYGIYEDSKPKDMNNSQTALRCAAVALLEL
jgi:hypothetical protein